MAIMKDKFIKDFLEAQEVDKMIVKYQIELDDGVAILKDMLQYVEKDIEIMDVVAKEKLDGTKIKLEQICQNRKKELKMQMGEPENTMQARDFTKNLLKEDHKKYQKELFLIQELAFKTGWFD